MQFTKLCTALFSGALLAGSLYAVEYKHDLQFQTGVNSATKSDSAEVGAHLDYNGEIRFTDKFSLPLEIQANHFLPINSDDYNAPVRNYTYPISYVLTGGLKYSDAITIRANGFTRIPVKNNEIGLPFSLSNDPEYLFGTLKERYRIGTFLAFKTEKAPVDIDVNTQFVIRNYLYENSEYDSLSKNSEFDSDLWIQGSVAKSLHKNVGVKVRYFGKSELSSVSNNYDMHQLFLGVTTDMQPVKRKLYIFGDFYGTYYTSENMVNHGYLKEDKVNLGINSHVRAMYKLKKRLFLKGDVLIDVNSEMQKFRYELAVRNVFNKTGSASVQAGMWTTPGALISRHCGYVNGSIALHKNLALIPEAKSYWKWIDEGYKYYRSDFGMNLAFRLPRDKKLFKSTRVYGGALYRMYQDEDFYPSSLNLYAGVKTYL